MKRCISGLSSIGIIGIILVIWSCSKEVVNPLQKYWGIYDYYISGPTGSDDKGNFPIGNGRLVIREASDNKVSLTIYEFDLPNEKVTTLPSCEIISIDTTGNKYQPFARIVNTQNNIEIGKIRFWYYGGAFGKERETRLYIPMDFMIEPNRRIVFYAMKRKD